MGVTDARKKRGRILVATPGLSQSCLGVTSFAVLGPVEWLFTLLTELSFSTKESFGYADSD